MTRQAPWVRAYPSQKLTKDKVRRRVPAMSKKRRAESKQYEWVKSVWRVTNKYCAMCGELADPNPHHIIPRSVRPDLWMDPKNFLPVNLDCHNWIGRNPKRAYELGLLGKSTDTLEELEKLRFYKSDEIQRVGREILFRPRT